MTSISDYERSPTVGQPSPALAEKLKSLWETKPGFIDWLGTVDHKEIGLRYNVTAFAFLLIGRIEALALRVPLAWSNIKLLKPEQLFRVSRELPSLSLAHQRRGAPSKIGGKIVSPDFNRDAPEFCPRHEERSR